MAGGTYSFLDVQASFNGAGGIFAIGSSAGAAEEGISYAADGDINTMTAGADSIMHSLRGIQPGTITVRLLKTSPTNGKLQEAYNLQKTAASLHGNNTITINSNLGDQIILTQAAFQRTPDNSYAKDGNVLEWTFQGVLSVALGKGVLNNLA